MGNIREIIKQTQNRFVNLYELKAINKKGKDFSYFVASRAKDETALKINTRYNRPDGVVIYSVVKGDVPEEDRVVLVKQYRYSIDDFVYELPAGLVEDGEDFHEAAIRELKEETGLLLHPLHADSGFEKPGFTTIGMTDEACATVFGYAEGSVSEQELEDSEEIEVILADRKEAARILREEHVAIICAYQMMHFLHDADVFGFLR